mgnify:CR=1 FL=1
MNEPQKKYLTTKERICFTVGAFGRSGIYTLMSMFTLVFFQNGAGLSLSQGTTIILIGRIFDALNDPVMGMIVDRTKSKWGKMRPYLLFAPVPIAICTILLFTAPFKEGSTAAFVWALVTYILWGVVPAMAIFPLLRKKFRLKQIYIGSALFGFAVHGLCYVILAQDVTKINIFILWIFLFLMGLPLGIYNVITYALIADSIDYLEWKTGERQEGVCFAFQTFLSKVNAAIATFVFGQLLAQTDFKAVDKSLMDNAGRQIFFEQSASTQKMLLALVVIRRVAPQLKLDD